MSYLLLGLFSYLLGAVPSPWMAGLNRRQFVRRSSLIYAIGLKRSLGVAGIDFAKGVFATLLGLIVAGWGGACVAALAVNAGAIFPVFHSFQGTKSVGTAAGALLVLSPFLLLAGLVTFILVLFLTQYLSLSSILSTAIVLILVIIYPPAWFVFLVICLLGSGVLFLHRESFSRLAKGKEPVFPIRRWMR